MSTKTPIQQKVKNFFDQNPTKEQIDLYIEETITTTNNVLMINTIQNYQHYFTQEQLCKFWINIINNYYPDGCWLRPIYKDYLAFKKTLFQYILTQDKKIIGLYIDRCHPAATEMKKILFLYIEKQDYQFALNIYRVMLSRKNRTTDHFDFKLRNYQQAKIEAILLANTLAN